MEQETNPTRDVFLPFRADLRGQSPYGAPQLDVPVRLNVNENPYSPSSDLCEAISASVTAAIKDLNRYPDRDFSKLRCDLSDYLAEESGVRIAPDLIWAANGSNEIMMHILQAFAGPQRVVASFLPSYSMYPEYTRDSFSTWVAGTRKPDFSLDFDEIRRVLDVHHPSVVFLASPNNPTGTALSEAELREILELTRESGPLASDGATRDNAVTRDTDVCVTDDDGVPARRTATIVVVDEAYAEFRREGVPSALELLDRYEHLIVTRTMSKAFGAAGLRLGYMAAAKSIIEQIMLVRLPYHLSAITQAAASAALTNRSALMEQVAQIRADRDSLACSLQEMGFEIAPSDANFVFFGKIANRHQTWQDLLNEGVLIREVGPDGWLRVSVGTPAEKERFLSALHKAYVDHM
ncbi:histidinol-phosphate transaminase [Arcanobacterium bovis]|uniref:Histidinol-phosphate aminotransferase n=1 Tax=Arcanobacterium bovis TaxID=2529275 RepID=A0A4Q9V049_9ACTO|nr:histidinol-phosphate transaminase [Arcanobacterium bovis]TBW21998.1 histidinol-phosphate transaminase [Arcanobacterium bovis]